MGVEPGRIDVGPLSSVSVKTGKLFDASQQSSAVAVLDADYATTAKLATGGTINVGGTNFTIIGTVASTSATGSSAANVYIPLAEAQSISGLGAKLSTIYVAATSADKISSLKQALQASLTGATVNSQEDLANSVSGSLATASTLIEQLGFWLSLVVLAAAVLIATLFTISGVSRRTREFGALKALGWSNLRITAQVAGESLVQGLIGGGMGLALGLGAVAVVNAAGITLSGGVSRVGGFGGAFGGFGQRAMQAIAATPPPGGAGAGRLRAADAASTIALHAPLTMSLVFIAIGLAVAGGLVAGAFGGWRAARLRPAAAMRSLN